MSRPSYGVRGQGYTLALPEGWHVVRSGRGVAGRKGDYLVSVTHFPLLKPYEPARFGAAAKELDGVAARLAAQEGGTVSERETTTVAGRKIRAYRLSSDAHETRIGFVLDGRDEYQLLCQGPPGSGTADPDGACALLFDSFKLSS